MLGRKRSRSTLRQQQQQQGNSYDPSIVIEPSPSEAVVHCRDSRTKQATSISSRSISIRRQGSGLTFGRKHPPSRGCTSNRGEEMQQQQGELIIEGGEGDNDVEGQVQDNTSNDDDDDNFSVISSSATSNKTLNALIVNRSIIFSLLVGVIGFLVSTFFLGFGISQAVHEQESLFYVHGQAAAIGLQRTWKDYESAARWIHQACTMQNNNITHNQFRDIYEYFTYGLEINAIQWVPKVLNTYRFELENSSSSFLIEEHNSSGFVYNGITGFEPTSFEPDEGKMTIQNRTVQLFYYPIHLVEPMEAAGISSLIDFDLFSSQIHRETINLAFDTFKPVIAPLPELHQNLSSEESEENSMVMLLHPGIPLPSRRGEDIAGLQIQIKSLVRMVAKDMQESLRVYIFDSSTTTQDLQNDDEPIFLIGADVVIDTFGGFNITYLDPIGYDDLIENTVVFKATYAIPIVQNANWEMVVVAMDETFEPNVLFITVIGEFTLIVCLSLALWIFYNMRRTRMMAEIKRRDDKEKADLVVASAQEAARAEKHLNDYIAHEVRNPVSAALSACAFVKASVNEKEPMRDETSILSVREDVDIIDSSLKFVNALLRSMLDMHGAASKSIQVQFVPVDVRNDILQPIATMLYCRDKSFDVLIDCEENLEVMTDRLRLKQVVLNLGRKATKFVHQGFVKLGANVVDNSVRIFVADSGFGIGLESRDTLFSKYQESLEVMNQGTGMGLYLCKHMVELMAGDIWLDETYDSGIQGYPGSCFIIDLKAPCLGKGAYERFVPDSYEIEPALSVRIEKTSDVTGGSSTSDEVRVAVSSFSSPPPSIFSESQAVQSPSVLFSTTNERAQLGAATLTMQQTKISTPTKVNQDAKTSTYDLPDNMSVLFVDDDLVLRKLFMRSLRKATTNWTIKDASSGETALDIVESEKFDVIFMDQYMTSVEKQLLGTETTRALRSKGVTSIICGLSANDTEQEFLKCGADCFMLKPFPCKPEALRKELHRILFSTRIDAGSRNQEDNPESFSRSEDNNFIHSSPQPLENSDSTSQMTQSSLG